MTLRTHNHALGRHGEHPDLPRSARMSAVVVAAVDSCLRSGAGQLSTRRRASGAPNRPAMRWISYGASARAAAVPLRACKEVTHLPHQASHRFGSTLAGGLVQVAALPALVRWDRGLANSH